MSSFPIDPHLALDLGASAALLGVVALARRLLAVRIAARTGPAAGGAPLSLMRLRLGCGLVLLLGFVLIWFDELQSLLWSLTAVAAAFVIATKELIQCVTGALMRAAGGSFRVGDVVEIDGIYGRIVAHGLLATTVAEMEKGSSGGRLTGRRVVVPNSRLFAADLRVAEEAGAALSPLSFHLVIDPHVSTQRTVAFLEAALQRFCEPFSAAREAINGAPPLVTLETTELGRVRLDVSCLVPPPEAVAFEREIKMEVLEWLWAQAQARQMRPPGEARFVAVNDRPARAA